MMTSLPSGARILTLALLAVSLLAGTSGAQGSAITPREPIALFNGKDLSNFIS